MAKDSKNRKYPVTVSIIMPNYNGARFIGEAIDSVLAQSFEDWELLICDDASTDKSVSIIQEYTKKDSRIHLLHNKNTKGQAGGRNTAIDAAQGRFIAFLDSDDIWYVDKLKKQLKFIKSKKAAMSYTWYDQMSETGKVINEICLKEEGKTYKSLLKNPSIGHLTGMYDRKELGTCFMPQVRRSDDLGLWLSILKKTPLGYCLPEKLACYRITTESVSSNKLKSAKAVWHILKNVEKLPLPKAVYYFSHYAIYGVLSKGKDMVFRFFQ
ncbi:MAG: glycosyltransferase family 2 protein [Alphaproteobacteria bacterium]